MSSGRTSLDNDQLHQMVGIEALATVGLGFDAAGALMIVLPEFEQFLAYKIPEAEIEQTEQGRVTLLSEGELTADDPGFEAVCEALEDESRRLTR